MIYRGYTIKVWQCPEYPGWFDYTITKKKGIWYAETTHRSEDSAINDAKGDIDRYIIHGPRKPMSVRAYKKKFGRK